MESITTDYLTRSLSWLVITTLIYFLMNGAQIFETAVVVPKWTASPPESFKLLAGEYGLDLKTFWIAFHSIHELTFILAVVFCWKLEPVRNWLLILFGVHFAVRIWTLAYFAPGIIEFQRIASTGESGIDLLSRVTLWRTLNYVRVTVFVAVSIGLIPICVKVMSLKFR